MEKSAGVMVKITRLQSNHLNRKIEAVEDAEKYDLFLFELASTGKVIPYIGWAWHDVDFTKPIWIGHCGEFAGFLEDNEWNYPRWQLSEDQDGTLKALLLDLDLDQNRDIIEDDLREIYRHIQACIPEDQDIEFKALSAIVGPATTQIERGVHVGAD